MLPPVKDFVKSGQPIEGQADGMLVARILALIVATGFLAAAIFYGAY